MSFLLIFTLNGCVDSKADSGIEKIDKNELVTLKGAGATFPAPLYQLWIKEYINSKELENLKISYDSVGSGAGVTSFVTEKVDFGATDAPLKMEEKKLLSPTRGIPMQFPMTGGLVVFAYNLSNFESSDDIKLSREVYCDIVSGKITSWNDPKIAKDNPNVRLPNIPLIFVYRSDGSGTTFIFTNHLKSACPNWDKGSGKKVDWGIGIGGNGNEGVTAQILQTQGAIGYIEYSYAKDNQLQKAVIQNKTGNFIKPSPESAAQAFVNITIPEDFALVVPDPDTAQAYPIVGLTWLLVYENYPDATKSDILKDFVRWSLTEGSQSASTLGYIAIPEELKQKVLTQLNSLD